MRHPNLSINCKFSSPIHKNCQLFLMSHISLFKLFSFFPKNPYFPCTLLLFFESFRCFNLNLFEESDWRILYSPYFGATVTLVSFKACQFIFNEVLLRYQFSRLNEDQAFPKYQTHFTFFWNYFLYCWVSWLLLQYRWFIV